jgi:hypothetical protein
MAMVLDMANQSVPKNNRPRNRLDYPAPSASRRTTSGSVSLRGGWFTCSVLIDELHFIVLAFSRSREILVRKSQHENAMRAILGAASYHLALRGPVAT